MRQMRQCNLINIVKQEIIIKNVTKKGVIIKVVTEVSFAILFSDKIKLSFEPYPLIVLNHFLLKLLTYPFSKHICSPF